MKTYTDEPVTEIKKIHNSTTCNKCGKKAEVGDYITLNLMHDFKVSFGYGSNFDMDTWDFDLCEECLLDIVKTFAHMPDGFASYLKYPQLAFDKWKIANKIDYYAWWSEEDTKKRELKLEEENKKLEEMKERYKKYKGLKN